MLFTEYAVCANHGVCNYGTGECRCERGYHGFACDDTQDDDVRNYCYQILLSVKTNWFC